MRIYLIVLLLFLVACAGPQTADLAAPAQQAADTEHDVPELPAEDEMINAEITEDAAELGLGLTEDTVEYYNTVSGFLARPAKGGSYPGVVMIHEWWGLNDHIKDMARQLAAKGYVVLAVDLYNGEIATTSDEARALVGAVNQDDAVKNMKSAVEYLKSTAGAQKVGSLGWCFGGKQSLQLSLNEPMDATVIYYGNVETDQETLQSLQGPVLGVFGSEDRSIPPSVVNEFDSSLDALGHENDINIYDGVGHAFANPSNAGYSPEDTQDAWDKTTAFLAQNLK